MIVVVDASVAAKAYMDEVGTDAAIALLTGEQRLVAPELIRAEVAAAICRRVRRGDLDVPDALVRCERWLSDLARDAIGLVPDHELMDKAIRLSVELKHSLQDCLYLAAARHLQVPLITADRVFKERVAELYPEVRLLAGCEGH